MVFRRMIVLICVMAMGGCLWSVRRDTDRTIAELSSRPYDVAPPLTKAPLPAEKKATGLPGLAPPATDIQTTALMVQADTAAGPKRKLDLEIPPEVPGAETPRVELPKDKEALKREIKRIYPELPALPTEPEPQPGPDGRPYTLADFQRLAAENSPVLRQAASDVEAARGNLIQAKTYQNPTVSVSTQPTNNNAIGGAHGLIADQTITTGGKMRLRVAAAQKNLDNAELALRRARSDLATQVRNAYYALLVARETMVVSRALARFTDDVYRMQTGLLEGALAAPYEPASLRALAYTARLAYKQSISSYIYAWKQIVAVIGLRQLPLAAVEGHIDRLIPYFDYDAVLRYSLTNHTDVLTARNAVDIGRYNLKLAQVTPLFPDVDVNISVMKDTTLSPFGTYHAVQLGVPLPIWDQNKGNIIAAQAALTRAAEESHRVEVNLTNNLAAAYVNYKNNLDALEYYRRYILPDQVRAYRGIYARRQIDPNSPFGDLVSAQQTLAANVTTYLGILGSLWSSAVAVADFLQTDDFFKAGEALELPALPSLDQLPPWNCPHPGSVGPECTTAVESGHFVAAGPIGSNNAPAPPMPVDHPPPAVPVGNALPEATSVKPPPRMWRRFNGSTGTAIGPEDSR